MEQASIEAQVIDAIQQEQTASGRPAGHITAETRPTEDVDDFDSHNAIQATILLSVVLGKELPDDIILPPRGNRALTVKQIANNIKTYLENGSIGG